jgi:hypothetical protein
MGVSLVPTVGAGAYRKMFRNEWIAPTLTH